MPARHSVVIDLGSNSFRLVAFAWDPGRSWRRIDEIYDGVRIGAGLTKTGRLKPERARRALEVLDLYAHYCSATGFAPDEIDAVATSAIRDADDGPEFVAEARRRTGLPVRVLSAEEEAFYGYVAAINSTTLSDGLTLDLGGGSLQLVAVEGRERRNSGSWPLGTVRMTERFLSGQTASREECRTLRCHVKQQLREAGWPAAGAPRVVGIGGTVRNLAAAAQRRLGLPAAGIQGFALEREMLSELVAELAQRPVAKRGQVPGIKPERAGVILAGAITLQAVLNVCGADAIEATEAGLREGVFLATRLGSGDPLTFGDVRAASVRNLASHYQDDLSHSEHVAQLCAQLLGSIEDRLDPPLEPEASELLNAAALLHDIGMSVDYDDHHKHSRYLVLAGGLPGFSPREVALIAQAVRYHRKGAPAMGELAPLTRGDDDERLLARLAALLRLGEHLDRARDGSVHGARLIENGRGIRLELAADDSATLARWGAEQQAGLFERAFGRPLVVG